MLKISNLTKIYKGNHVAVDDLSIHIKPGDIYGFIGHNGAGKTTTLKCVVGMLDFDSGEILIDGISIKDNPKKCKQIMAYIPDNPDIYSYLTGIQYLNFIADIYLITSQERTELISKYGDDFELTPYLGNLISSYSHGMKQKLSIIAALIHKPKLLILDEPFVGLDPKAVLILKNIMKKLCEEGVAIFFSTHVLDVAEKLCNKVAIIKKGKLIVSKEINQMDNDLSLEEIFMETLND